MIVDDMLVMNIIRILKKQPWEEVSDVMGALMQTLALPQGRQQTPINQTNSAKIPVPNAFQKEL